MKFQGKKMRSNGSISKPRIWSRVTILVASMILLSLLSVTAMAINAGCDSVWAYISSNFKTILGMDLGEEMSNDGITIIKNSQPKYYDSIEELLATEGFDIYYPSLIPNNQSITEIRYVDESRDNYALYFVFSDGSYLFHVVNYYITNLSILDNVETVTVNDMVYYISSKPNNSYHAICQHNGFEYSLDSNNYEDLLFLIYNMKG